MTAFPFTIHASQGQARTGVLKTPRGDIPTPIFMPVGTAATVKALTLDQVRQSHARIILGNTYHLMLRPGPERIRRLGGLHTFMGWHGPNLTESGGYQVMRLSQALFGIQQGATFEALRRESTDRLLEIGFDGYAIGGLAVGEGHQAMCDTLDYCAPLLPWDRPRYLMGVGKPIDLLEGVARGVDMFDCVLPTRS